MRFPRILYVGNFFYGRHIGHQYCWSLSKKLEESEHVVLRTSGQRPRVLRLSDMILSIIRWRYQYDVGIMDVFSGPSFAWAEACAYAFRAVGKPCVMIVHGGALPDFVERWPRRVRRVLKCAAVVCAPSGYIAGKLSKCGCEIRVIPNGVEVKAYPFRLRRQVHPRLVWLRAFQRGYDPAVAVRVAARLEEVSGGVQLFMIGPDKGDGSLEETRRIAVALGIAERVEFVGRVKNQDVPAWLSHGDIFLNTTRLESFGVAMVEAMACGLCVVASRVGGIPWVAREGREALLVDPGDDMGMARKVRMILEDPVLAERLSLNGRRRAEEFDWSAVLPQWERLLEEVADRRGCQEQ